MRDGLTETSKAADAAKVSADISAKILTRTHRPRLVVRPITIDGFAFDGTLGATKLTNGKAWITNVGTLPATLLHFHAQWIFDASLPLNNPARTAVDPDQIASEIGPGAFGHRPLPDYGVGVDQFKKINNAVEIIKAGGTPPSTGRLFLVGYIKYSDDVGLRRTFFCFAYDPELGCFVPFTEHHNYSYEE